MFMPLCLALVLAPSADVPVTIEVVDAATAAPLPCRVSIRGADGTWHFPKAAAAEGRLVRYERKAIGRPDIVEMHATLSAHPVVAHLPEGTYTLAVSRGKEYHVERRALTVRAAPTSVKVPLRRWINMAEAGHFSGDTHTHRSMDELPNVMLAEDLNIAFPLNDWVREAFVPPIERRAADFRDPGPATVRVDDRHLIAPRNTEYEIFTVNGERHTLGAFFVINHQTPLDLGAPPVVPVAERAHREGALIELDKHNWPWSMALVPIMPVDLYELTNNHVWETEFAFRDFGEAPAEAMNIERDAQGGYTERGWVEYGFQNYYALLNCGFRLRPTAGTASGVHPVPLGFGRVYVQLDGPFDRDSWLRGLNAGRSFVTTGPMLLVTLDGHAPGEVLKTDQAPRTFLVRGEAQSARPLDRIEVVRGGEVVATVPPANRPTALGGFVSPIEAAVAIEETSWVAVRCYEKDADGRERFAHSSPTHVDVPGKPIRPRKHEAAFLIQRVEDQIERSAKVLPPVALDEYRKALQAYREAAQNAR